MASPNLGKIEFVDIREIWKNEARDFTPWLFANSDSLAKALGINLELHKTEHPVGRFSLDLIGTIPETQERVIIENQLESSDHGHFGQLLTYAGGTEANYVIWIAREFKEEYVSAIQWLNNGTTDEINFFAVEVSAIRIGESKPAPMFTVVAQPNGWQKQTKAAAAVALTDGRGQKQIEFWTMVIEEISKRFPDWTNAKKAPAQHWFNLPSGVSGIWFPLVFTSRELRVEIYFGSSDRDLNQSNFDALKNQREAIESAFGEKLIWHFPGENKHGVIRFAKLVSFDDEASWPQNVEWLLANHLALRNAVHPFLNGLR